MKSKKFKYIILSSLLCVTLGFTSCEKWLNVTPSNQITDENLFKDALGARNALNGVYSQISSQTLFGRNFTWGLYSAMGHDYMMNDIHNELRYSAEPANMNHGHANVIDLSSSIWTTAYNTIANCNKLITEVQQMGEETFPLGLAEKNLILGEAKGIRALLHFELLRLYAHAPQKSGAAATIPYVDKYPAKHTPMISAADVISKVVEDLESARDLVAENDTIRNRTQLSFKLQSLMSGSNTPNGGLFFNFRMNRLNFVAISTLLARVQLYGGNIPKAKEAAEYVYANYSNNGRLKWWAWTNEANSRGDHKYTKFADDIIFAPYDVDLTAKREAYVGTTYRFRSNAETKNWFPSTERDYRYNLFSVDPLVGSDLQSDKWKFTSSTQQWRKEQNTLIPVLRMSEIYLIYAEALYESGDVQKALTVLNQLRAARGKMTTFSNTDRESFFNELLGEYRREFIQEGQTAFAYKRLNRAMTIGSVIVPIDNRFKFPIPDGEQIF